eukprot:gene11244-biopygen15921
MTPRILVRFHGCFACSKAIDSNLTTCLASPATRCPKSTLARSKLNSGIQSYHTTSHSLDKAAPLLACPDLECVVLGVDICTVQFHVEVLLGSAQDHEGSSLRPHSAAGNSWCFLAEEAPRDILLL